MIDLDINIEHYTLKYVRYDINGKKIALLTDPNLSIFHTNKWEIFYDGWFFYLVPKQTIKLINSTGNDETIFWLGNEIEFPFAHHWSDKIFTRNKLYIKNDNDEDKIITKRKNAVFANAQNTVSYRLNIANERCNSGTNTIITLF